MDISALRACFTNCLHSYRRDGGDIPDSYSHRIRTFSQDWLGIGKWPRQKMFVVHVDRMNQPEEVTTPNPHFSKCEMAVAITKMILLFPVTIFSLIAKLVDYFSCQKIWIRIANKTSDSRATFSSRSNLGSNVHTLKG